jgi:DnaJ-class molecular chaperone
MIEIVSVCMRCGGTGLLYWGKTYWKTPHYVPCPQCCPDEEQRHPHRFTVRVGDGVEQTPRG